MTATTNDVRVVASLVFQVAEAAQQLYALSIARTNLQSFDSAVRLANAERAARTLLKRPIESDVELPVAGIRAATAIEGVPNATEQLDENVSTYVERVRVFMEQARAWCTAHGLRVESLPAVVIESCAPKYLAPSLLILNGQSGVPIAELLPTGSAIMCAQGRIDLKGCLARHALLYQTRDDPERTASAASGDDVISRAMHSSAYSGHAGDGWYWREAQIRKAKLVDESLFLEMITDVSDHEFQ
ncbi:hypothetical protein [Pararobbsia alpina]|uniref:hypothetical protein n=1 Tax=Pararobbsia alpina TaxID=621374 RepID=UPI0039A767E4